MSIFDFALIVQMDFLYPVPPWPSSVACQDNASISCSCCRGWYRPIHCVRIQSTVYSRIPTDGSYVGIHSFIGLSSSGLGVIGGDTVNFVGLGGCKAEDYISTDLSGYCARRVLQNPTVWLGIFLGGYALN